MFIEAYRTNAKIRQHRVLVREEAVITMEPLISNDKTELLPVRVMQEESHFWITVATRDEILIRASVD